MHSKSTTPRTAAGILLGRHVDHVCYSVPDLDAAALAWVRLGVGPFLTIRDAAFERVEHAGQPAIFEHSAAFAKWGETFVELNEVKRAIPEVVDRGVRPGEGSTLSHLGYDSADPEADSSGLEKLGYPLYLYAKQGPIEAWYHYLPELGHSVELHRAVPELEAFWLQLTDAATSWDGQEPLRPFPTG
jgi:hypothetical protein